MPMIILDPPISAENLGRILLALVRSKRAEAVGIYNVPPIELNAALIRTAERTHAIERVLGHELTFNSGYRAEKLNSLVGGASKSQHRKAEAADIECPEYGTPTDLFTRLLPEMELLGIDQLILEPGWVHVSFADKPRLEALHMQGGKYARVSRV